jgi:glycolate oxidase FAD binding subunit
MSAAPQSSEELAAWLRDLPPGARVVPRGLGANFGGVPERAEIVDTTGLATIDHRRDDFNVSVGAGVTLGALQAVLGKAGQRISLDPPAEGTLGGMLATSARGPLVTRYGGIRDLVIGATVVLGDGTIAHSGGRVIKNVAGYDLAKLLVGARGMLGVVTEVVLRCHPLPQSRRLVEGSVAAADLPGLLGQLGASGADPVGLEWSGGRLAVLLEGTEAAVEADAAKVAKVLPQAEAAELSRLDELASLQLPPPGGAVLAAYVRSSRLPEVLARLAVLGVDEESILGHAAAGILEVRLEAGEIPGVLEGLASDPGAPRVRLELRALGEGTVLSPALVARLEPMPAVLERLRAELDPLGRFRKGRWDVDHA